jgi:hypothetical protein
MIETADSAVSLRPLAPKVENRLCVVDEKVLRLGRVRGDTGTHIKFQRELVGLRELKRFTHERRVNGPMATVEPLQCPSPPLDEQYPVNEAAGAIPCILINRSKPDTRWAWDYDSGPMRISMAA